ncbi:ATP-binding protein [Magnetospira sp. QH-2]|uniref:ATP-binding protein n=1 Tax=Magnetospira sp. (strain QH-2) TaxID=1288970 RepID=UPI0003E818CC|nr:ATP-binding protein [Magnetospira sp. QH-2]CCQ74903.1 putative histidine kinase with PAS sensor domain [Magnetospira sp. QH-2]
MVELNGLQFEEKARITSGRFMLVLALLTAFSLLVVWAGIGLEIFRSRDATLQSVREASENLARGLAAYTERTFTVIETRLQLMDGNLPACDPSRSFDPEITDQLGRMVLDTDILFSASLVDADGQFCQSAIPGRDGAFHAPAATISVADRDFFFKLKENPDLETLVGIPMLGKITGTWVLPVARVRRDDTGRFNGVVLGTIELDQLNRFFAAFDLKSGVVLTIVRRDGYMVARAPFKAEMMGKSFFHGPLFRQIENTPHNTYETRTVTDGQHRIISYFSVDKLSLVAVVAQSSDKALAPWRHQIIVYVVVGLFITVILLALAIVLIRMDRRREYANATRLAEQTRLNRAILDAAPTPLLFINDLGEVEQFNRAFCDLVGRSPDLVVDRPLQDFLDEDEDNNLVQVVQGLTGETTEFSIELSLSIKDKGRRTFLISMASVGLEGGESHGAVLSLTDISRRKEAEDKQSRLVARLEESNTDLEQFAYVASHDLREPLRMVASYVSLLERNFSDSLDASGLEFIAYAREGALRLDKLVKDLLQYSRVGQAPKDSEPVSLSSILHGVMADLGPGAEVSGARIVLPEDDPLLTCNAHEVARLFDQLISNAIKFQHPDRALHVAIIATEMGDHVLFEVRDNGIGIDPAYHEKVFVIFQRLHQRERYEGTGVGLAICRKIVARHGGRIWIDSAPSEGTTVMFTLPKGRHS